MHKHDLGVLQFGKGGMAIAKNEWSANKKEQAAEEEREEGRRGTWRGCQIMPRGL